jgi:hypothetical protein
VIDVNPLNNSLQGNLSDRTRRNERRNLLKELSFEIFQEYTDGGRLGYSATSCKAHCATARDLNKKLMNYAQACLMVIEVYLHLRAIRP